MKVALIGHRYGDQPGLGDRERSLADRKQGRNAEDQRQEYQRLRIERIPNECSDCFPHDYFVLSDARRPFSKPISIPSEGLTSDSATTSVPGSKPRK